MANRNLPPLTVKPLHLHLHSALGAWCAAAAELRKDVGNVVPRVTVQTSAKSLLVEVVGNKTDGTAENEQTVEDTHLEVVLGLFGGEGTAVAHQVNEADSNAAVDVENEVVLLGGGDGLDSQGVVEKLVGGELGLDVLLDKLDTEIGVVAGLDTVTNTGDELVRLAHVVDELTGAQALVKGLGELLGGTVKGTTEAGTDGQETSDKGGDEILAGTGGDDGVHGTGYGRAVVGSKHENHLEELGGVGGEAATEPQKGHDTTDANFFLENVGDGHASVQELLTTVVGNGGDEGSGLTDETELLGPGVVDGDLGNNGLRLGLDGAVLDEGVVESLEDLGHLLEGLRDVEASLLHLLVLGLGRLQGGVGEGTGVTELNLSLEHAGAGTNGPGNDGLGNDTILNGLDDLVLLNTTNLTEQDEDLAVGIGLVSEQVVDEGGSGVSVTTNGHTLVDTVGVVGDNVVELVGHTTRLGDVTNGTLAVQLGGNNVVHHATSVTNLEAARLDTTNSGGANDGDALLLSLVGDLTSALNCLLAGYKYTEGTRRRRRGQTYALGDTLSNDGNGLDLGELHQLHSGGVDTSGGGEVDDDVDVGVLGNGLGDLLVDGQESLAGSPVHLGDELTTESVDDTGDGGGLALADEVEVEHTLNGAGLQTVDETSGLVVEQSVFGKRAQRTAGSREACDVVVGRQAAGCLGAIGTVSGGGGRRHCEESRASSGRMRVSTREEEKRSGEG